MFYKVISGVLKGIEGVIVNVEVDISQGIPVFDMTGTLAAEVKEAKERVRIAIKNSGYVVQPSKITVNISPADIRKAGTGLDLPIALGVLGTHGFINHNMIKDTLVIGELSLDGKVNCINGVLPIVLKAKENGIKRCIIPKQNGKEVGYISDIECIGVEALQEVIEVLTGRIESVPEQSIYTPFEGYEEFDDIIGQEMAKKATAVACAGHHNILYIGPPGIGKTMLAKRMRDIMPPLTLEESIELSKIYSVCGLLDLDEGMINRRPFRSPHNKITASAMFGGGQYPMPGEVSLSSYGILFLDELPLFKTSVINSLRIPLEEKHVLINRMRGNYTFPADFMLVGAMNPCPCGNYPDRNRCSCTTADINKYFGKLDKAFLDRIDISVEMPRVNKESILKDRKGITISEMRKIVLIADKIQKERYKNEDIMYNSQLNNQQITKYCRMDDEGKDLLISTFERLDLSLRVYNKIIKVARTIADINESEIIKREHILEAISYRV